MIRFLVQIGRRDEHSIMNTELLISNGRLCFPEINNKQLLPCNDAEVQQLTDGGIIRIGPYVIRALEQQVEVEKPTFTGLLAKLAVQWSQEASTKSPGLSLNDLTD